MDQQSLQQLHDKFIETYEKSLELFPELKNWKRPSFRIDITGTTAGKIPMLQAEGKLPASTLPNNLATFNDAGELVFPNKNRIFVGS